MNPMARSAWYIFFIKMSGRQDQKYSRASSSKTTIKKGIIYPNENKFSYITRQLCWLYSYFLLPPILGDSNWNIQIFKHGLFPQKKFKILFFISLVRGKCCKRSIALNHGTYLGHNPILYIHFFLEPLTRIFLAS